MNAASREVIAICPVCDHELEVTCLHCAECDTTLEGRFSVGRFGRLNREQLALLESFLRARGNLRDLERELGISYPTVRNRLEALIRALGLTATASVPGEPAPPESEATTGDGSSDGATSTPQDAAAARRRVLERLAAHEIDAQAAAAELRALEQGRDATQHTGGAS
jgi:hypothetical protein